MPRMRMNQAVSAALADEMRDDPDVIVFGEDVAAAGGPFKATAGLLEEFGSERVRDTPISEMGFLGAAVGAALTGLRPVVEIMFVDFLGVALDQLVTQGAKMRYLSGGKLRCPLTVRTSTGAVRGYGAQHSQTLENWLVATPGLVVVAASGPQSAYSLLRAAIRCDDPVVFMEPRARYGSRADVSLGEDHVAKLGVAEVESEGSDVTILGLGSTMETIRLAVEGSTWSAEVVDLRTLAPWDRDTVLSSVAKTGRLVIVEESPWSGGWGNEIAAYVSHELFGDLLAPVVRVTCPDTPVPHPPNLEQRYLPSKEDVVAQVDSLIENGRALAPWWLQAVAP